MQKRYLLLVFLWIFLNTASAQSVLYVNANGGNDNNTGTSWVQAYATLTNAISKATAGTDIWVAKGIYTAGTATTSYFTLKEGVRIYGGFAGTETSFSQRVRANIHTTNETILEGAHASNNAYHVVVNTSSAVTSATVLDGFVIQGGKTTGTTSPTDRGGGIYNNTGTPVFSNLIIRNNTATSYGAGIYNGGAATFTDIVLQNNITSGGSNIQGGGIFNSNASATFTNITLQDNRAAFGGAIYTSAGASFTNITCVNNVATSQGGAIYTNAAIQVYRSSFINNSSAQHGGAIFTSGASRIENSIFSRNKITGTSAYYGGAIYNSNAGTVVTNSSFSGNSIAYVHASTLSGGALYSTVAGITVNNSIFWGNTRGGGVSDQLNAIVSNITHSIVQGAFPNGNTLNMDPKFVDAAADNLQLQPGSPAIDGGNNANNNAETDIVGNARLSNSVIDIGAHEHINSSALAIQTILPVTISRGEVFNTQLAATGGSGNHTWTVAAGVLPTGMSMNGTGFLEGTPIATGSYSFAVTVTSGGAQATRWYSGQIVAGNARIYVRKGATGLNNGSSWTNAFTDLQSIQGGVALSGDEVWVAKGDYSPGAAITATFTLIPGVKWYGGFSGTETTLEQRDLSKIRTNNETILNGNNTSYHVVSNTVALTNTTVLDGFTIANGNAASTGSNGYGAGIYNVQASASPLFANLWIRNNVSSLRGGGLYNTGSPVLNNVIFENNTAQSTYGGGMSNTGTPVLQDVQFISNIAGTNGGGVYNTGAATLNNVAFSNNEATTGGGLYNTGSGSMTGMLFTGNKATTGGGMYNTGSPVLTQVTVINNSSAQHGGGIYTVTGTLKIENAIFSRNKVTGTGSYYGGGLYNATTANLVNVTFSNNSIAYTNADANLRFGAGLYNASTANIYNSILWGNTRGSNIPDQLNSGTIGNSLVQGGFSGTRIFLGDPLFVNAANDDLRLRPGSLAIDAGDNSRTSTSTDMDNNPRVVNNTVDLGGYEIQENTGLQITTADPAAITKGIAWSVQLMATGGNGNYSWTTNGGGLPPGLILGANGLISGTPLVSGIYDVSIQVTDGTLLGSRQYTIVVNAGAARIYVMANATGMNNGSSWTNAYTDLQHALAIATAGDEIWVAKGSYSPGNLVSSSFTMVNDVKIYGGFAGTESNLSERSLALLYTTNASILDGGNNSYHVIHNNTALTNTTLLDGFIITKGKALTGSTGDNYYGAGIYNNATTISATFRNLIITANTAAIGAGIYNKGASANFIDVQFNNNTSTADGAGMYNTGATIVLNNVGFASNTAGGAGAGMYSSVAASLTEVSFTDNTATGNGGGLYITGVATLTKIAFQNNRAAIGGGLYHATGNAVMNLLEFTGNTATTYGGGMYGGGSPTLTDVHFHSNTATTTGGGFHNVGAPTLNRVSFINNTSVQNGGGMYSSGATKLFNVVFSRNRITGNATTGYGGGFYNFSGSPTLTNVTFSNNTLAYVHASTAGGGGLYSRTGTVTISNSIFWNNNRGNAVADQIAGSSISISKSIVQGGFAAGTSILMTDPQFQNASNDSLQLKPSSPAVDAGDNSKVSTDKDMGGDDRIYNDIVDIGAYEYQGGGESIRIQQTNISALTRGTGVNLQLEATGGTGNYTWSVQTGTLPAGILLGTNGILSGTPMVAGNSNVVIAVTDGTLSSSRQFTIQVNAGAARIYVKQGAVGFNNGANWTNAFTSMVSALAIAQLGDEIWVAKGTYTPGATVTSYFTLKEGVKWYGGFAGTETQLEDRDTSKIRSVNETILSGNNLSYHVLFNTAAITNATVVDGFTISGGKTATGSTGEAYYGAGIYNIGGAPVFNHLWIKNNTAHYHGGGMYNTGPATFTNVIFQDNTATTQHGGGLYNSGAITISHVTFINNIAGANGGGLWNNNVINLNEASFSKNRATSGGGMLNSGANSQLNKITFSENTATATGGGLHNTVAVSITGVQFRQNIAGTTGGGLHNTNAAVLDRVAFVANSATQNGGGMWSSNAPKVTNTIFSNNRVTSTSTYFGGGMFFNGTSATLTNVTFSNNSTNYTNAAASKYGGGLYLAGGSANVSNSIFWGNTRGGSVLDQLNAGVALSYSIVQDGYATGTNILIGDPLFVNATANDLHTKGGSAAIDAGDNSKVSTLTDLDGATRIFNNTVDLGAYENQGGDMITIQQTSIAALTRGTASNIQLTATGGTGSYTWALQSGSLPTGTKFTSDGKLVGVPMVTGTYTFVISVTDGELIGNKQYNVQVNAGNTILFTHAGATGQNTGSNWDDAFTDLQTAFAQAISGDQIWVGKGTYIAGSAVSSSFTLKEGVKVYGGFAGTETTLDQRDTSTIHTQHASILSGNNISYHVVFNNTNLTNATVLDGFIISGGKTASGSTGINYSGGGMYNASGNPVLANLQFIDNSAHLGAGLYNTGNPQMSRIVFQSNKASSQGGGMYNTGNPVMRDVRFLQNTSSVNGAGLFNTGSPGIDRAIFELNISVQSGGAIYHSGGNVQITNTVFHKNRVTSTSNYAGAGVYAYSGIVTLTNATIAYNTSSYVNASTTTSYGGGLFRNTATVSLHNSILWGNTRGNNVPDQLNAGIGVTHSIVQLGYSTGTNILIGDPQFLQAAQGDLRLKPSSSAIDAGDNSKTNTTLDLKGEERIFNDIVDLGAYESQGGGSLSIRPLSLNNLTRGQHTAQQFTIAGSTDTFTWWLESGTLPPGISLGSDGLLNGNPVTPGTYTFVVGVTDGNLQGSKQYTLTVAGGSAKLRVYAGATGNNNGSDWTNAFTDLVTAMSNAIAGDEIWVAKGSYSPGSKVSSYFTLKEGIKLYGGFAATEERLEDRDTSKIRSVNETILTGNNNSYHVVFNTAALSNATVLDGFTISGGRTATGSTGQSYNGAGIYNTDGAVIFNHLWVKNNTGHYYGGGIFNQAASARFSNIIIANNAATYGGGMYNSASAQMSDLRFLNNTAYINGGGLYNTGQTTITQSIFNANQASTYGGGVYTNAALTATDMVFVGNTATSNGGGWWSNAAVTIGRSRFINNISSGNGGGIYNSGGSTFDRLMFIGNRSANNGGGLFNSGNSTITNSVFSNNRVTTTGSYYGGAIYHITNILTASNLTFSRNSIGYTNSSTTTSYGGALYRSSGTVTIHNSIFWGNTRGGNIPDQLNSGSTVSHSIVQHGYATGSNILIGDPAFRDEANDSLQLRNGSIGIDVGDNNKNTTNVDLNGNTRIVNDVIDLGAYEQQEGGDGLVILPASISNWTRGTAPLQQLTTSGGTGNYTWSVQSGSLPIGIRLMSDGLLAGTPMIPGTYTFVVSVTDGNLLGSKQYTLQVGAGPARLHVYASALGDSSGSDWNNAIKDLQLAIAQASAGDEIWVGKGTYSPGNKTSSYFTLKEGVKLYGGFAATETSFEMRDTALIRSSNETILSGNNVNYHVLYNSTALTTATVVDGFTVSGGKTLTNGNNYTDAPYVGAGLYNYNSGNKLILRNMVFKYNQSSNGGAIFTNGTPSFENIRFENNTALFRGGALYNTGTGSFSQLWFNANSAQSGGAVYNAGAAAFTGSIFTKNTASTTGGAMYTTNDGSTLTNIHFEQNKATQHGGAWYSYSGSHTVTDLIFHNNQATLNGGALFVSAGTVSADRTHFIANTAGRSGGGVYNNSTFTLLNSTFSRNKVTTASTYYGGAVYQSGGTSNFINVSFSNNTIAYTNANSSFYGGALYKSAGVVNVYNSIFWGNKRGGGKSDQLNAVNLMEYALIEGGYVGGTNVIDANPWFIDADSDSLRVRAGSIAIDGGNNSRNPSSMDISKAPREVNGTIDLGAYESQGGSGLTITPVSITNMTRGVAPATQLSAEGGTGNYTWSLQSGKLPTGITLSPTGSLTGTPMVVGSYTFVVNVQDENERKGGKQYTVQVGPGAARLHVLASTTGNNDGNDWNNAFTDLQTAITQAVAGDEIWVGKGTYSPGTKTSSYFVLKDKVKIYGGFAGTETDLAQRDPDQIATTNKSVLTGNNTSYHVVYNNQPLSNATILDGFTISNGKTVQNGNNYTDPSYVGAGLYNDNSSNALVLRNLVFTNNTAANGAAIYTNGSPTFTNIRIQNNTAQFRGGGIYAATGTGKYQGLHLEGNSAGQSGGAIFNTGNITIDSATFKSNTAGVSGGGLYTTSGTTKYSRILFEQNSSTQTGAAVYVHNGTHSFDRIRFINNSAVRQGGAVYTYTATTTITNSIFSRNKVTSSSAYYGGAIYQYSGTLHLINNSFSNNSIAYSNASTTTSYGGAIYKNAGTTNLSNSILWNNARGNNVSDQLNAGITVFNSLIMGGYSSTNIILKDDPLFTNASADDLTLTACSPAINMGDASKAGAYTLDLSDATRTASGVVDLGAYEYQGASLELGPLTLPNGNRGTAYEAEMGASGGNGNYTYQVTYGKVPDGLAMSSNGTITGSPIAIGTYVFNIAATDGTLCGNKLYTVEILPGTGITRIYVNQAAQNGQNNGSTWNNAYLTIQQALNVSQAGDEIWVAKGSYSPGDLKTSWFTLKEGVKMYGGFAGTETTIEERDTAKISTVNETILTGNNKSYHVLYNTAALTNATVIDGFTIAEGSTLRSGSTNTNFYGAGFYNASGSPILRNMVFRNNNGYQGGAIYNNTGSPILEKVLFTNNTTTYYGGAMSTQGASAKPVLTEVQFINNTSTSHGGAMYIGSGQSSLTDILFSGNKVTGSANGGGLYNAGTTQMLRLRFENNSAYNGGGLFSSGSNVTATDITFQQNTARYYAGAAYLTGTPTFNKLISIANTSQVHGGAFFTSGTIKINNAVFSRNSLTTSYYGGAIYANSGTLTITNSSFSRNSIGYVNASTTVSYGGAIYRRAGTVNIYNSIFWNNKRGNNVMDQLSANMNVTNSIVENGYTTGKIIITANPEFIDPANDDLTLSKCSPAINMGDNTRLTGITTDLLGQPRIQESTIDMGAFENQDSRVTIVPATLPAGVRGTLYNQQLSVTGGSGNATYKVSYGKLPDGLVLSESGLLSGKPILVGSFDFNIVVNDGEQCGNQLYKMDITQGTGSVKMYVNNAATTGANNGGDWANGYLDLQQAFKTAMANDTIWVAKGTYSPGTAANTWFTLTEGVKVFGGFAGTETTLSERDSASMHTTNETILSGAKKTPSYHIIFNNKALTNKTILDGFTISDGKTASTSNTTSANYVGGGIYNVHASAAPVFRNLIIKNNKAVNGGGMFNTGTPTLINVQFLNNSTTTAYGGALYNTGAMTLENVTFSGNTAASYGGAVYTATGKPVFKNTRFINNSTPNRGGAIYIASGGPEFTDVLMGDNRSTSNNGGALFANTSTTPSLTNALFINNTALYHGGAIYNGGALKLTNGAFSRNRVTSTSAYYGGAIYTTSGAVNIVNSTFAANSIAYSNSSKTLSYGGGLYRNSGTVTVSNSILWNNRRGGAVADQLNASVTVSNSLVEGGYATGKVILTKDPMFLDAASDSLQLSACSPAVNLGDNSKISGVSTDLAGNTRIKNDLIDLGAYEYQGQLLVNAEQTLPDARQWKPYSHQLVAGEQEGETNYQYNLIYGELPDGYTLKSNGLIEGTAELVGEYEFGVAVQGADICGTIKIKLNVLARPPFITEVLPPYPLPIDVKTGTSFQELKLVDKVEVVWSDKTKSKIPVTWLEGNYNGNVLGKYTLVGELTVEDPEQNPDTLTAFVNIVVIDPVSKYIIAVQQLDSLVVRSRTPFNSIVFPATVEVLYSDSTTEQLAVQWKSDTYLEKAGIYRIHGDLVLTDPESNPAEFEALIDVHANNDIIAVDVIQDIFVELNTAPDSLPLPPTVKVTYNDSTTSTLSIEWDLSPYVSHKAGTYSLNGNLVLKPNTTNSQLLKAAIEVHILKKVVSVAASDPITVPFETAFEELPLPDSIQVTYNDGTTGLAGVNWISDQYNSEQAGEQAIKGELLMDESVSNEDSLMANITVTVLQRPRNIDSVAVSDSITIAYGTSSSNLLQLLPKKVFVAYDDNGTDSLFVIWDINEYDSLISGSFTLYGLPELPENIRNMDSLSGSIIVTIANKYIVRVHPADTISVANGTVYTMIDLPDQVTVTYNDSTLGNESVQWTAGTFDPTQTGYYTILGVLEPADGTDDPDSIQATLIIYVLPPPPAITAITDIDTLLVPYATTFTDALLLMPQRVEVSYDNGTRDSLSVTWEEGGYLPYEAGAYEMHGQLILPDTVNNPLNLQPIMVVKVGNRLLTTIAPSDTIQVAFGTAWENVPLPETVMATFSDLGTETLPVVWEKGTYDSSATGIYVLIGNVEVPEHIDNPLELKGNLVVVVLKKQKDLIAVSTDTIRVAFGTPFEQIPLPTTTIGSFNDSTTGSLDISSWDMGLYDPQISGEYLVSGTITLPDTIQNPDLITAQAFVIVEPRFIVSVETLTSVSVPYGTTFNELTLPDSLTVTFNDGSTGITSVNWLGETYMDTIPGTYNVKGELLTDDTMLNKDDLFASIEVTVLPKARVLVAIATDSLVVNYGTAYDNIVLPPVLEARFDDSSTAMVTIQWLPATYNAQMAGEYLVYGTPELPADAINSGELQAIFHITVDARTVIAVVPTDTLHVTYGTAFDLVELPQTLTVTYNDNQTQSLPVTWDPGLYDPETAGIYSIAGRLIMDEGTLIHDSLQPVHIVVVDHKLPNISAVDSFSSITVPFSTSEAVLHTLLPQLVKVTYDDLTEDSLVVNWDISDYDSSMASTYTIKGTLVLKSGTTNLNDLYPQIDVIVNKKNIVSVAALPAIQALYGQAFSALTIPANVLVTYNDGSEEELIVLWNELEYEPEHLGSQTISGTLQWDESVTNTNGLKASLQINSLKDVLSIAQILPQNVVYGTPYSALNLPENLMVTYTDNSQELMTINWDTTVYEQANTGLLEMMASFTLPANVFNSNDLGVKAAINITKAPLTIRANDTTRKYGEVNPAFTWKVDGFVKGETIAVLSDAITATTLATETSSAGTYDITITPVTATNYEITLKVGTLTVGKAQLTITAHDQTRKYGEANPAFTVSYQGFMGEDDSTILATLPVVTTLATTRSPIGEYALEVGDAVSDNYEIVYKSGKLLIEKAELILIAEDKIRPTGEANPTLTYTALGLKGDDALEEILTTLPTLTTLAVEGSVAGQYTILITGAAAVSYTITYTTGNLYVVGAAMLPLPSTGNISVFQIADYMQILGEITSLERSGPLSLSFLNSKSHLPVKTPPFKLSDWYGYGPVAGLSRLVTYGVRNITTTGGSSGGFILDTGGETVTARGICWSTQPDPTIADQKTVEGTGTGAFTSVLSGLTPGTKYYIRAYATTSSGTAYGNQVVIITQNELTEQ